MSSEEYFESFLIDYIRSETDMNISSKSIKKILYKKKPA
jgi:hypothetical protein